MELDPEEINPIQSTEPQVTESEAMGKVRLVSGLYRIGLLSMRVMLF